MTARREAMYAAIVALAMILMFGIVALLAGDNRRLDDHGNRFENTVLHLQDACDQRPDGSAICEPGAFTPYTTTTTTVP